MYSKLPPLHPTRFDMSTNILLPATELGPSRFDLDKGHAVLRIEVDKVNWLSQENGGRSRLMNINGKAIQKRGQGFTNLAQPYLGALCAAKRGSNALIYPQYAPHRPTQYEQEHHNPGARSDYPDDIFRHTCPITLLLH